MKRKTNKALWFLFVISCFCTLFFITASAAEEVKVDGFVFSVDGSSAVLKEYTGNKADVEIPSKVGKAKVTAIGNEAFWANKTMKSITIPTTVKVIGTAAFNECTALTKINIPYSVTTMGDAVFWYCTNLKQVIISKNATTIGDNVFVGCHKDLTVYVTKGTYSEKYVNKLTGINVGYRYITGLSLSSASVKLPVGNSHTLTYTVSPSKVYNSSVTYTSSDTSVATVSSKGKITAVGTGTATITCTAKDGSKLSATCKVTVTPHKVTAVTVKNQTVDGYTLTWEKTKGATGYKVYKYNSTSKKYEGYKSLSGNSLTFKDQKPGSSVNYKVYAYAKVNGLVYYADASPVCKASTAKPGKVAEITAKPAHNYINLSWEATEFATDYKVYTYNRETAKYTYLGATSKTTYKVSGLSPDTCYTFMVKAYLKHNGTTVNASYSPLKDAYTRPDYVSGLSVVEGSVYTSKVTLEWELIDSASGYVISRDDGTGNYVAVYTITDPAVNSCTLEGLQPGTEYLFKIRSYSDKSGSKLYGYICKTPLSVTTNDRPSNESEAFKEFVDAYNASLVSDSSYALISLYTTSDFEGESSEKYEGVVTSTQMTGSVYSYFSEGTDKNGLTAGEALHCTEGALSLEFSDAEVTYFDEDGNGFCVDFTVDGENAAQLFGFTEWERVAEENEGFVLDEESISQVNVTAKVQNGLLDNITVTVPVTVSFTLAGQQYSFTQTYTATYLFIR